MTSPIDRYLDRARRVAEEFGPGHSGVENLATAIAELVHEFVQHDMEWAALSVEGHARDCAEALRARGEGRPQ